MFLVQYFAESEHFCENAFVFFSTFAPQSKITYKQLWCILLALASVVSLVTLSNCKMRIACFFSSPVLRDKYHCLTASTERFEGVALYISYNS